MTTTYDPFHPKYFDEADLREEMDRVYDLCHGCRLCFKFCTSFPTLFDYVDAHDQHADRMTPAEQDQVVDGCFQCKLCNINCPYTPDQHEWALDFPRLMLRAAQVRRRNHGEPFRDQVADQALGRTDLVGKINTTLAPSVNRAIGTPGSLPRKVMEATVGIAAQRLLPPYARQRFSSWFRARSTSEEPTIRTDQGSVALFATCIVEYQAPEIGKDVVKVLERKAVSCTLAVPQRSWASPWLYASDFARIVQLGNDNVRVLAEAVRQGRDIVVAQPTCGYVLKNDYMDYLNSPDAELVASNTYDAAEYLWRLHKGEDTEIDTEFHFGRCCVANSIVSTTSLRLASGG